MLHNKNVWVSETWFEFKFTRTWLPSAEVFECADDSIITALPLIYLLFYLRTLIVVKISRLTAGAYLPPVIKYLSRHKWTGIRRPIVHTLSSPSKRQRFASLVKLLITEYFILCLLAAGMAGTFFLLRKQLKVFGVF